jgi:galactose mutarotase-like enzyme
MFTHQQSFDHFELHTLSDSGGNLLEIAPTRGGIVTRLDIAGQPVLYMDRETLNDASKNVRGGNPVLFPICGPLAGGNCQIDGKTYSMKQHGFARNLPWSVLNCQAGEQSASISLRLESNDVTRAQYPFDFKVDFTYRLSPKGLAIEQRYENLSDRPMPFYAGFHPYFAAPQKQAVKLDVAAAKYDDFLSGQLRDVEPVIDFDTAPEINGAFHNVDNNRVRFDNFGQGRALEILFEPPYKHVVIWALKDKPFICVEPWMGLNNSLNTGESVSHLAPGAHLETAVSFNVG